MFIIGITGGTGCGKTTALKAARKLGGLILDCDEIYHLLLLNNDELKTELIESFPKISTCGVIDRNKLGKIVFSDPAALLKLNEIAHKYVDEEVERRLKAHSAKGGKFAAIDAVALLESDVAKKCDVTVGITAPEEVRISRIMRRDGIDASKALKRLKAQKPDSFFIKNCDYILHNKYNTEENFVAECENLFIKLLKKGKRQMAEKNELLYSKKSIYETITDEESAKAEKYCEEYKLFLDNGKTERESVTESIKLAEKSGFLPFKRGMALKPGAKVYVNVYGKALMLAVIGKKPLSAGVNIAASHIDSPRLDLKQVPLYEDGEMAFFKTHYYGGIKKYQWVAQPLSLHGLIVKKDGEEVEVRLGENENDPMFMITDLLPHLGKDQAKKTLGEAFTGENLNILVGSRPTGEKDDKDKIKLTVMTILNEKYGITEEDLLSAELQAVPLMNARDMGFDRTMIAAYGHDDRSAAFASLKALFDLDNPEKTAVCILSDKEEVGSDGVSGMQSAVFDDFMESLCDAFDVRLRDCYANSFCLSADVCCAFDPNFADVTELQNNAKLGYGIGVLKYTGSRGKGGASDASAETVAHLRSVFDKNNITWQTATLGKVDQGGGGTVAKFMANRNIATIDAGVPVLSMHAPYEIVSKLDCYMTYRAILAVYNN